MYADIYIYIASSICMRTYIYIASSIGGVLRCTIILVISADVYLVWRFMWRPGLLTATVSSEVFRAAQPALLYLVPFTLLPLVTMAYLKVVVNCGT